MRGCNAHGVIGCTSCPAPTIDKGTKVLNMQEAHRAAETAKEREGPVGNLARCFLFMEEKQTYEHKTTSADR